MANVATLNIGINALYGGALAGFQKVSSSATSMGSAISGVTGRVTGFTTSFVGMAAGLVGVGSAVGSMTWGVSLAAQAETAQASFETMLKSPEKAKTLLADLRDFAASTPFEMAGISGAAKKLLAFGEGADNIVPTLRALGDISSGIDAPLGEIAELYGKARVQGRLFQEDINQFTGRGVPLIQELAKQFNVTEGAVKGLVEKGSVNFTHLQKAVISLTSAGGIFEGNTQKQSTTLSGLWSTAKDNIGLSMQGIAQAFIDGFNVKGVIANLSTFAEYVQAEWVPVIRDTVAGVAAFFGSVWESVGPTVYAVFNALRTGAIVAFTTANWAIQNWWDLTVLAATGALLGIVKFVENVKYFFGTVIPTLIAFGIDNWYELGQNMINITASVVSNLYKNYTNFWKSLFDYMYGNSDGFEFVWTPLTDGFKNAVKNSLVIPDREMGNLEKSLQSRVDGMAGKLRPGLSDAISSALADKGMATGQSSVAKAASAQKQMELAKAPAATAKAKVEGPKAVLEGTKEAFEAVAKARMNKAGEDAQTETAKNTGELLKEARKANDLALAGGRPANVVNF